MFRDLKSSEIDVRVAMVKKNGVSLLLYKNARVDQDILDETVTPMNWQRKHSRDNANCEVGIWDKEKQQWIWKEDTGTESNTEKEESDLKQEEVSSDNNFFTEKQNYDDYYNKFNFDNFFFWKCFKSSICFHSFDFFHSSNS